jgi:ATP-binding cassette subfamily F protein uup
MEEDWLRYGVTARRKRNVRRLAALHDLRAQRRALSGPAGVARLEAADTPGSGKLVAVAENVGKAFGERVVIRNLTTRVLRGDRVGIIGPNGAGKTTLLKLLTGQMAPDSGRITLGAAIEMVTLDQRRESLDPDATLADTLTGGRGDQVAVNGEKRHVIGYMKDFLFAPEQARTRVGVLSGGERGRLALAVALAQPANLLVLDEPTNDLDLETLELLQEMLAEHPATVLLVSHDRDFLDRVCTSVIAAEGDGRWVEYAGGYSDMLAQRGEAPAEPAARKPSTAPPPARVAGPVRKLSFKDKHELENLPARMQEMQARIARLNETLADPTLYSRDRKRFDAATADLAASEQALAAAEERWLELEMLREELAAR